MDILRDITIGMTTVVSLTGCTDTTEQYLQLSRPCRHWGLFFPPPLVSVCVCVCCCWGSWLCICVLVHQSVWGPVSALSLPREDILLPKSCLTPIFGFRVWDLVRVKIRSCGLYEISQGLGVHECWSLFEDVSAHLMLVHDALIRVFMAKCVSLLICIITFHVHQFPCSYARL